MRKAALAIAAMLGMGAMVIDAPAMPAPRPAQIRRQRRIAMPSFYAPALIGTKAKKGSAARDKRAAVKAKNRKANRRNHV